MLSFHKKISFDGNLTSVESDILLHLIEEGIITHEHANIVAAESVKNGFDLVDILIRFGFVLQNQLNIFFKSFYNIEIVNIKDAEVMKDIVVLVPKEICMKSFFIPYKIENDIIFVALKNAFYDNVKATIRQYLTTYIRNYTFLDVKFEFATAVDIVDQIEAFHTNDSHYEFEEIRKTLSKTGDSRQAILFVESCLKDAVGSNASDIHIEPEEVFVRIRYRIDGVLQEIGVFHKDFWSHILNRIKILSSMNIAESRHPQDGRIEMMFFGREVDFRVSAHPTVFGENIVIRILDKKRSLQTLENIGISGSNFDKFKLALEKPEGIIIVTGPTGSGKTTTLYSALAYLSTPDVNIMTLEDPVEYTIPLIRQTPVKDDIGLTFDAGIRALMRQDPDIMLIGEIRDLQTAEAAIRASLTGHKVLTTLHTIDSIAAIQRLTDIGVNKYMLSGNITAIVAQRLVRKLCDFCKKQDVMNDTDYADLKIKKQEDKDRTVYRKVGCVKCKNTGYSGRIAVVEVLTICPDLDDMIARGETRKSIVDLAKQKGFLNLFDDARKKVLQGLTDISEIKRTINAS